MCIWPSLIECSEGYTEFDDEFIRQIIQKITVEDADTGILVGSALRHSVSKAT